jgi:hypothetical protein
LDYSQKQLVSTETNVTGPGSLVITSDDTEYIMYAEYRCPDESQPDGLGTPVPAGNTNPVEPDFDQYTYVRWVGTYSAPTLSGSFTQSWGFFKPGSGGREEPPFVAGVLSSSGIPVESGSDYITSVAYKVPWRASLTVSRTGLFPFTGTVGSNADTVQLTIDNLPGDGVYSITGRWEFSNDQSTVLQTWNGR